MLAIEKFSLCRVHNEFHAKEIVYSICIFISLFTAFKCLWKIKYERRIKRRYEKEMIPVEHAMGKTEVPANPKRVVILTNEGTEALLELGVKPVGAVKSWTGDPWYPHIKDKMKDVKVVGDEGQVNVETIASLKPDLIIGNKMRHEKCTSN